MKIIEFECLPSTSQYIKDNLNLIEDNVYVIARNQTNGRGRTGNSWISSKDNLMFSFKINPNKINVCDYPLITLLTGLAVRNTLSYISSCDDFVIKWPNDIIYDNKKICGIIAEGIFKDNNSIIIGIGINVNQDIFCEELKNKATSLKIVFKKSFDKNDILEKFDEEFRLLYKSFENHDKSFIETINDYNYLKEKEVLINNEEYENKTFVCMHINSNGNLVLRDENNNLVEINSIEVTLKNIYN